MLYLAHEAGSGQWDGIVGLIAIAVIVLLVCSFKLAWLGMLAFVHWMLPSKDPAR